MLDQWEQHRESLATLRARLNDIGMTAAMGTALIKPQFSVTLPKLSLYSRVMGLGSHTKNY